MAIDDVYVVTINQNSGAGIMQNSLAFIRTSATEPVLSDFQAVANAMKEIHRGQQGSSMTYSTFKARQFRGGTVTYPTGDKCTPLGGQIFEGSMSGTLTGGQLSTDFLPPQCALVTTLRTAQVGRRRRGRYYCGGFNEISQSGGGWTSGLTGPIDTAWGTFFSNYAVAAPASGFRLGIWSMRTATGCEPGPTGKGHVRVDAPSPATAFEPCTSYIVRPTVFTQRRRVFGVGR